MREELVKTWNKWKKDVSDFSTLSIDDMKTKKKYKSSTIAKTQQYLHKKPKGLQLY